MAKTSDPETFTQKEMALFGAYDFVILYSELN